MSDTPFDLSISLKIFRCEDLHQYKEEEKGETVDALSYLLSLPIKVHLYDIYPMSEFCYR